MVLIYSHITSPRLQYICRFIFKEQLGVDYIITIDAEEFKNNDGLKINYSTTVFDFPCFTIQPHALLFENGINMQHPACFKWQGNKAFFKTENSDWPFDIFAASFYLISRYEEYLPHIKDGYGRYAHENSLAFKEEFLNVPLINVWLKQFAEAIKIRFPNFNFQSSSFNFFPTYDIDIAYSYKYKGLIRNLGGFFKKPSLQRIKVLIGLAKDPYDAYKWMNSLHTKYKLEPIYFFLLAEKNGRYDKNILPYKTGMWQLVKQHAKKYAVGIHPSWQSGDDDNLLKKEIQYLDEMRENGKTTISRQHYIRFTLPQTYRRLIEVGIADDYSMGYGSINGFRASVAASFFWYDLENEVATELRIHPFCFMEANSYYEQKYTSAKAYDELIHYYTVCKENNGTLITIWHNNFLGTDKAFAGWKDMYELFLAEIEI
jgi:hypothetical protein